MVGPLVGLIAVALFVTPSSALADATLTSVGATNGHAMATWTLAPGSQAVTIDVATSPLEGSDGSFFDENFADGGILTDSQTSWLSSSQLAPGTYYVHVSSLSSVSFGWSNVLSFTIPVPPPPPPVPTTVLVSAFGSGSVTSSPAGISCPAGAVAGCEMSYPIGTVVSLTATPAPGSVFTGWLEPTCAAEPAPTCTFTVGSSLIDAIAGFEPAPVTATPKPVTPAAVVTTSSAIRASGRARLAFRATLTGSSKTSFLTSASRVYVTLRWLEAPSPLRPYKLIWLRPNGRSDGTTTGPTERVGVTSHASLPSGDFKKRPGRWTVKLTLDGNALATASFVVHTPSS
jgi:Divergent InlB B-repeat domain